MRNKIHNEKELVNWILDNYSDIGYDEILEVNTKSFPDIIAIRDGKKVRVEVETRSSNFLLHKHPVDKVDEVVCIEEDVKVKTLKGLKYVPKKAKRVSIQLDDEQIKVLNSIKGFGSKDAEKIKAILMIYLSEKGYVKEFNKKK